MTATHQRLTVVVGASRGLGHSLALRAAERGDRVLACARQEARLTQAFAGSTAVETLSGDFLAPDAPFDRLTAWIETHDGPVSLVLTAATLGPVGSLVRADMVEWAEALQANVAGSARVLARCLPHLDAADLVVVFAGGGVGGPNLQPHVSAYTTSKVALVHLVEIVARENPDGPTVVAIAPGAYPTGFSDPVLEADPDTAGEALLDDVRRTRSLPMDTTALDTLLGHLESAPVRWLSGRTLSAKRDVPDRLVALADQDPGRDLFTLRRVDGEGVTVQAW